MVLGWPGGNESALNEAAASISKFAGAVDAAFATANTAMLAQMDGWEGKTAQATRDAWAQSYTGATTFTGQCTDLSNALTDLANKIHDERTAYATTAGALVVTSFLAVGLSWASGGASDLAGDMAGKLGTNVIADILRNVSKALDTFAGKMAISFGIGATVDAATQGAIMAAEEGFDKDKSNVTGFSVKEMLIGGGAFVALGAADEITQGLSRTTRMITMLTTGGTQGLVTEATSEYLKEHDFTAGDLLAATLLGAAGGFAGKDDDRVFYLKGDKGTITMNDAFTEQIANHKRVVILVKDGRVPKVSPELQREINAGHVEIESIAGPKTMRMVDGANVTPTQVRDWAKGGKEVTVVVPKKEAKEFKDSLGDLIDAGKVHIKVSKVPPVTAGKK